MSLLRSFIQLSYLNKSRPGVGAALRGNHPKMTALFLAQRYSKAFALTLIGTLCKLNLNEIFELKLHTF